MSRYIPRLVLFGALLSLPPSSSNALGLGEIRATSALNQPFQGEIELVIGQGEDLKGLKVGLASSEIFARYGVDRPAFLGTFRFEVARSGDGRAVIRVSSTRSIAEPFVTLLVEAVWPRGRVLREYTVLLDPPVYMPQQQPQTVVTAPQSGPASPGRIERDVAPAPQSAPSRGTTAAPPSNVTSEPRGQRPAPAPEQSVPAAPTEAAFGEGAAVSGSYSVQRNDTLLRIAERVRPASGASVNQTMLALFRANPQAFSGNINRLRAGSVLRIPDASEMAELAGMNAAAEVSRQNAEWREGDLASGTSEAEGRLRLVAPSQGLDSPTVGGSNQGADGVTSSDDSGGIAADQNRIALNDAGLAEMQRQQNSEPPALATQEPSVSIEDPVESETVTPPEAALPEGSAPAAVQESKPAPVAKPAKAQKPPAEKSLLDQLRQFWWVLVAAGVACGLLVMLIRRRREPAMDEVFADIMPPTTDTGSFTRTSRLRAAPPPEEESGPVVLPLRPEPAVDIASDFPFESEPMSTPAAPPTRRVEQPVAAEAQPSRTATARAEQQDVLGEADFHMAYGLYDQAADLVKIAMQREPGRREFKLKLLEIYFVWGNRDLFLETASELYESRSEAAPGEWEKVLIMGKQISPESPMFAQGAGGVHALDLVDVNLEGGENRVDVDLFAEQDMDAAVGAGGDSAPRRADTSLDFLLDRDDDSGDSEALGRTQETPTVESPVWTRGSTASTVVERLDAKNNFEQTAELSIDDLGLDVDESMAETGRLDPAAFEKTLSAEEADDTQVQRGMKLEDTQRTTRTLRDDEMTQLAPSLGSSDRTLRAPVVTLENAEETGTIYVSDIEQGPGDTVEQPRPGRLSSDTAQLRQPFDTHLDETLRGSALADETLLTDATSTGLTLNEDSSELTEHIDFDAAATSTDSSDTLSTMLNEAVVADNESGEATTMEPLTMSEVGTKLDLARAYIDMGDPDGARSILEEVLQEGSATQQEEAQQLLDSVRG